MTGLYAAASGRRWRTVPCDRISNGIRTLPQIPRSLLLDLPHSAARNVAIHPRTQRSASICRLSDRVRFGSRAFSSIVIDRFANGQLRLPLSFSVQKLASRRVVLQQVFGIAFVDTDHK
jgi:hypothetical protein